MNPADMAERGLAPGDVVEIASRRGQCLAVAEPCPGLRPRVVQLATGAWYSAPGGPGSLERNGNPNGLTPDHGTSRLAQGPSPNSCLVEIRAFGGTAPDAEAYEAPAFSDLAG